MCGNVCVRVHCVWYVVVFRVPVKLLYMYMCIIMKSWKHQHHGCMFFHYYRFKKVGSVSFEEFVKSLNAIHVLCIFFFERYTIPAETIHRTRDEQTRTQRKHKPWNGKKIDNIKLRLHFVESFELSFDKPPSSSSSCSLQLIFCRITFSIPHGRISSYLLNFSLLFYYKVIISTYT